MELITRISRLFEFQILCMRIHFAFQLFDALIQSLRRQQLDGF